MDGVPNFTAVMVPVGTVDEKLKFRIAQNYLDYYVALIILQSFWRSL